MPADLESIERAVRTSVAASLNRLRMPHVTLLQLHNSITARRGDEPTSVTPDDVLGPGGVLDAFEKLRQEGVVRHLGLTAIGQGPAMAEVVRSGRFATIQVPYGLLNPSAGQTMPAEFSEANYGNIIAECTKQAMGVLAIRVFAGGALLGQAPSRHTYQTKFFPLDLYQRDVRRAKELELRLAGQMTLKEAAVRFALSHPSVASAIIGFSTPEQVDEAVRFANEGPLEQDVLRAIDEA
jgi:aryl-alcohol dehydrogenase-like predicted oxidoreductase